MTTTTGHKVRHQSSVVNWVILYQVHLFVFSCKENDFEITQVPFINHLALLELVRVSKNKSLICLGAMEMNNNSLTAVEIEAPVAIEMWKSFAVSIKTVIL